MNVLVIDDQHDFFLECIRRLHDALAARQGASLTSGLLDEFAQFVEAHFVTEERLMESYEYPLRSMHALDHHRARLRLKELHRHQANMTIAIRMLGELQDWFEIHMERWDAKLGSYLNSHGVT